MNEPNYCSFDELIQSKLFTFYIGQEKKEFKVHSKAIAATSWHFHALVNNGMAQSQAGTVEYPDMDPEDFARFVEYAYRHDYTVPSWIQEDEESISDPDLNNSVSSPPSPNPPPPELEPEPVPEPEPEPEPEPPTEAFRQVDMVYSQGFGFMGGFPQRKGKKKPAKLNPYLSFRTSFDERKYLTTSEPNRLLLSKFEPQSNFSPNQDFTPVFLAHAKLYTFACMRLIDPLKRLALHKLYKTLLCFQVYERRVGDVVELAKYAYKQGEDRKDDGTIEPLRKLVVDYIVWVGTALSKHEAFLSILYEGGEFVVDFWRLMYKDKRIL